MKSRWVERALAAHQSDGIVRAGGDLMSLERKCVKAHVWSRDRSRKLGVLFERSRLQLSPIPPLQVRRGVSFAPPKACLPRPLLPQARRRQCLRRRANDARPRLQGTFLEPQEIGNLADACSRSVIFVLGSSWPRERRFACAWPRPFRRCRSAPAAARPTPRRRSGRPCARRDGLSICRGPIRRPAFRRHRPC